MKCLNLTDIETDIPKSKFDNFLRVDHLYLGSKVDCLEQIDFLKTIGVDTVVDLKSSHETDYDDEQKFKEAGINYYNLPIKDIAELKFETLQEFGSIISKSNNKTLVYCMSGNRVGAMLALNASFICGHPKKRALEFGEKVGMRNPNTKKIISDLLESGGLK